MHVVRHVSRWSIIVVLWMTSFAQSSAPVDDRVTDSSEETANVLPQLCALDSVYQSFEKVQQQAYLSDKDLHFAFLLDHEAQFKTEAATLNRLKSETGSVNEILGVDQRSYVREIQAIREIKLPTCYESPIFFYRTSIYVADINQARLDLHKPLYGVPRFGSLPSDEINGHTFVSEGGAGVIALNVELFDFIHGMSAIAASTVDEGLSNEMSESQFVSHALLAISYNAEAKTQFINLLACLVEGKPLPHIRLTPHQEVMALMFAGAMERFVVAHEFGHLIKNHRSVGIELPIGATGNEQYEVLSRTWQQEFEADSVGLELLNYHLIGHRSHRQKGYIYFAYALRAPLFFFDCEQLLDEARVMYETGVMPQELPPDEKDLVRRCISARASTASCALYLREDHPPAWLRRERLERGVADAIRDSLGMPVGRTTLDRGEQMSACLNLFWTESKSSLLVEFKRDRAS